MTIIESEIFRKIEPKELFGSAWTKPEKHELAPNVTAMSERFNAVSNWIATIILKESDLKRRQALIAKFIDIARELSNLKNYTSLNQICSALNSASVSRLKKCWDVSNFY